MTSRSLSLSRRLVLALDTPDVDAALALVRETQGIVGTFKVGLELFTAAGPTFVRALRDLKVDVFLDLKLHDIPNTVASAVREAVRHDVRLLTVHASGGPAMLRAAQEAVSGSQTDLLAVTVLTSLSPEETAAIGWPGAPADIAVRLAGLARDAGIAGCVCSPEEASTLRTVLGPEGLIVCPGIRAVGTGVRDDQTRVATARQAIASGADFVVVGRPIKNAKDQRGAAQAILDEIALGIQERS